MATAKSSEKKRPRRASEVKRAAKGLVLGSMEQLGSVVVHKGAEHIVHGVHAEGVTLINSQTRETVELSHGDEREE